MSNQSILRLKPFESLNSLSNLQGGGSRNSDLSSKNAENMTSSTNFSRNPKIVSSYTVKSQSNGLKSHGSSTNSD